MYEGSSAQRACPGPGPGGGQASRARREPLPPDRAQSLLPCPGAPILAQQFQGSRHLLTGWPSLSKGGGNADSQGHAAPGVAEQLGRTLTSADPEPEAAFSRLYGPRRQGQDPRAAPGYRKVSYLPGLHHFSGSKMAPLDLFGSEHNEPSLKLETPIQGLAEDGHQPRIARGTSPVDKEGRSWL